MTDQNNPLRAEIIGFDSGWGCRDFGCEDGPHALSAQNFMYRLREQGVQMKWRGPLGFKTLGDHKKLDTKDKTLSLVSECLKRLCAHVTQAIGNSHIPVVIGGDHSSAIGTWSGAVSATQSWGRFGLIWIDAHLDAHTHETSAQGKWGGWWHGQPVSALLGQGLRELRGVGGMKAKISPQHLSIIGPHSFEPGEKEFLEKNNVRVYYFEEVQERGFQAVFAEALTRATTGTLGFGLTLDLDAFHPDDAPGVGTVEDRGLSAKEVLPVLQRLAHHPLFKALEIAEFNPHHDKDRKTLQLIEDIVATVFARKPDEK